VPKVKRRGDVTLNVDARKRPEQNRLKRQEALVEPFRKSTGAV